MPARLLDITDATFGQLIVLNEILPRSSPRRWLCRCSCGNLSEVIQGNLTRGGTKSCGCLRITVPKEKNTKHGCRNNPLYRVWVGIHTRCTNKNSDSYKYYGARGISVCSEWDDFTHFKVWADCSGYKQGLSIDRKDTNKGYCPTNCRWTTTEIQNRNRNKQKNTSSKYIGVSWNIARNRWIASVKPTGKRIFLGYFENELLAAKTRDTYIIENNLNDFVLNFN